MFNTLKSKFIISFISIEIIFLIIIANINFNYIDKSYMELTEEKSHVTSKLLSELLKTPVIVYDLATLDDIVKNFSSIKNVIAIQVDTADNLPLSSYIKPNTIQKDIFIKETKRKDHDNTYSIGNYLFTNTSITVNNKKIAHLHFVFDTTNTLNSVQNSKNSTYIIIILALLIGVIVAYIVGDKLGKSLKELSRIAKSIAEDKRVSIPYKSKNRDEIGELFYTMNIMQELILDRTITITESLHNMKQFQNALNESAIVSKTDIKGNITYVNDKFCEVSGYSTNELIGYTHRVIKHPDNKPELFKKMWDTLTSKNIYHSSIKNMKKSGEAYYVDATIVPILDNYGDIVEYISIRYNITDIIDARNKAIEAKKAKEEFLSNMSHELRTPMNAILGFIKILHKKKLDEEVKYYLDIIDSNSNLLLHIINDILDLSKIENDKLVIDIQPMLPSKELHNVLNMFTVIAKEKSINFVATMDENTPQCIEGDLLRIKQIVFNFLSNAFKFTPSNKNIFLNVKYIDNTLKISVKDEGIGMSEDALNKIFNAFEQADSSTTRKYGGTGLGLTISQKLATLMGGHIDVQSKENEGSTFTLTIPIKECEFIPAETTNTTELDNENEPHYRGHVLVVEDNKTNQMLIKIILDDYNITYTVANDGLEAVEEYKNSKFDLVLMDENMPNMSGSDAFIKIREYEDENNLSKTPVVALTANVMQEDVEYFFKLGMDDFLAKPLDTDKLEIVLDKFLVKV